VGITTDRARLASRIEVGVRAFRNADATTRDLRYGRVLGLLEARPVKAAELPRITLRDGRTGGDPDRLLGCAPTRSRWSDVSEAGF